MGENHGSPQFTNNKDGRMQNEHRKHKWATYSAYSERGERFTVRASGSYEGEQGTSSSWRVQACAGQATTQGNRGGWRNWQGCYQPGDIHITIKSYYFIIPWQEVSKQGSLDADWVRRASTPLHLFST